MGLLDRATSERAQKRRHAEEAVLEKLGGEGKRPNSPEDWAEAFALTLEAAMELGSWEAEKAYLGEPKDGGDVERLQAEALAERWSKALLATARRLAVPWDNDERAAFDAGLALFSARQRTRHEAMASKAPLPEDARSPRWQEFHRAFCG